MARRAAMLLAPLLMLATACTHSKSRRCASAITFFQMEPAKRRDQLPKLSLAEQYEIYICGRTESRPPRTEGLEELAARGAAAVPLLREKLREADDDLVIDGIVLVFALMQERGFYDVASDADLMREIEAAAQRLKFEGRRKLVLEKVEGIRSRPPSESGTPAQSESP